MFENIQLAFQGVFGHKLRSFLTMLGIIIGIASIITIISTIKGTNEQIKQNLIGSGSNIVNVQLYQNDWAVDMSYQTPDGIRVLQDEQRDEMIALDGVADVTLYRSRENVEGFYYRNTGFSGKLYGVDDHYFSVYGYEVRSGRGFTARDFASASKNVILDETAAKTLFSSDDPIGKIVEISGEPFTVVGVVSQKSSFEPRINSVKDYAMYVQESSGLAFVPTSVWPVLYRFDEPQNVAVRATSTDTMTDAGKAVADYLTSDEQPAHLDCQHLPARWRCGRYEHHARDRHGAHGGDRPEKGHRRKAPPHSGAVPDGGVRADRYRRPARRAGRHRHVAAHLEVHGYADGAECPRHSRGGGVLRPHRPDLRPRPGREGVEAQPHRGPSPRIMRFLMQPPVFRAAAFSYCNLRAVPLQSYRAGHPGAISAKEGTRMEKKAVYPGSFDPFTNGHMDIVRKASAIFDRVYIVMAVNSEKRRAFDCRRMQEAMERALADSGITNCEVSIYDGLIAEYTKHHGIGYMVRGLRNNMDYNYEENIAEVNKLIDPSLEYVYFRADNVAVSSSMVKELRHYGQDVSSYVPPAIAALLADGNTER